MTRDSARAKCIEAMASAWFNVRGYKSPSDIPDWLMRLTIEEQTTAFDSLHGIARVTPIEATEEMIRAADPWWIGTAIDRAIAAGDLTNPPEKK